jgi:hypothetical protein
MVGLGVQTGALPCGDIWQDTRIEIPFVADGTVLRDVVTGVGHRVAGGGLALADLLRRAPVAVLISGG